MSNQDSDTKLENEFRVVRRVARGSARRYEVSVVPPGLVTFLGVYPGLTSWAIVCRPYGAENGHENQRARCASSVRLLVSRFHAPR
jgi:hypothetical protein